MPIVTLAFATDRVGSARRSSHAAVCPRLEGESRGDRGLGKGCN